MADAKTCSRCGNEFRKRVGLSLAQWSGRKFCGKACAGLRRDASDEEVVNMYLAGSSTEDISKQISVSGVQVCRIIAKYNLTRTPSERQKIASQKPNRIAANANKLGVPCPEHVKAALRQRTGPENSNWRSGLTISSEGHMTFTSSPANGTHAGKALHVVIAEWALGRNLTGGEVVHHMDENKLNNHPDNLQVMQNQSEHARHHAIQNRFGHRA